MAPTRLPPVNKSPKVSSGPFEEFIRRKAQQKTEAEKKKKPAESATRECDPAEVQALQVYDISDDEPEVEILESPPGPKLAKKNDEGRGTGSTGGKPQFPTPSPTCDVWLTTRPPLSIRTNISAPNPVQLGKRAAVPVAVSTKSSEIIQENNDVSSSHGVTGSNEQVGPHPRWGQVSYNKKIFTDRVILLDWIDSVSKNVRLRDDVKLEHLKKVARWGQNDEEHAEIRFAPVGLSKRRDAIRGYYVHRGSKKTSLAPYYAGHMRDSTRAHERRKQAGHYEPESPHLQKHLQQWHETMEKAPKVEIIYVAGLCRPEVKEATPFQTIRKLEPVSQDDSRTGYNLYPGITAGKKTGLISMRDHLSSTTSELRPKIFDPTDPKCLYEIFTRMCDSPATRSTAESFYMEYGDLFNKEHLGERFIYTKAADLPWDLYQKVQKYVTDHIPLFVIVPTGDRSQLPKNKYCTLEDLTTLPIRIGEEEIVLQYDPSDPDLRPTWRRVKDAAALLREFPNPPDCFFYKKKLKAECEALMNTGN